MLIFSILPLAFLTCVTAIQSAIEWRKNEIWDRLGSLSPYHSAPAVKGVPADLPCDCTVNQIMLVSTGCDYRQITIELWLNWPCLHRG